MFGDTPLIMVEDPDTLAEVCDKLSKQPIIGVDTESDSFHHYQEKVCLIQLSGPSSDYIVDPLAVPDLAPLKVLLEDPDTQKILHGSDYDVVCLKRDFDISLTNVFDTMIAGQFLAFERIGLADLIRRYFGVKLDKKYQRHDWSRRPLLEEHLHYARGDTHWLLAVAEVLRYRLIQAGRLQAAQEEWGVLEQRTWSGRTAHGSDFLRLKQAKNLDISQQQVLRALWDYREDQARQMDRPSFKVMPGDALVMLARQQPADMDALADLVRVGSSLHRRHGQALLLAIQAGQADERPIPKPPKKTPDRARTGNRGRNDQLLGRLKVWRNQIVDRERIAPVVVANNQLLKEIATAAPADLEALGQVTGIRRWQVATYGPQLVALVQQAGSSKAGSSKAGSSKAGSSKAGSSKAASSKKSSRRRRRRRTAAGQESGEGVAHAAGPETAETPETRETPEAPATQGE